MCQTMPLDQGQYWETIKGKFEWFLFIMDANHLRKWQFHWEQLQWKGIPDRSQAVVLRFQSPGESPAGCVWSANFWLLSSMRQIGWVWGRAQLFVIPRIVARQAHLSLGILQARILEWVVMPPSRGSSQPRDQTQVSHAEGGFFMV